MSNERQTKKAWEKPELIVLVRSKPEEAVLITCKDGGTSGTTGPSANFRDCMLLCVDCSGTAPS